MYLERLDLTDFRSYIEAELVPAERGITVITGVNGAGKTNLIEAVGYLATLRSLRGSPAVALVREGASSAVVRSVVRYSETGRRVTIDAQLQLSGRDTVRIQGQPLRRTRDLLGALQVTVFSPDDLDLVKGGPAGRRSYLDDLLVALQPRRDLLLGEVERVLKQRNALLKSAFSPGRKIADDVSFTLDVWDSKLAGAGEELAGARRDLVESLSPLVSDAYSSLTSASAPSARRRVALDYRRSWSGSLAAALATARTDDLRRGVTTVGPHRDELALEVGGMAARTHASQGEQRTLALALRLAGHRMVSEATGSAPVLLLDDVFSELDRSRGEALLANLPEGQAVLTTAGEIPEPEGSASQVAARFRVEQGKILG